MGSKRNLKVTKICETCGKAFHPRVDAAGRFCSSACSVAFRKAHASKNRPPQTVRQARCVICNRIFNQAPGSTRATCSRACHGAYCSKRRLEGLARNRAEKIQTICLDCKEHNTRCFASKENNVPFPTGVVFRQYGTVISCPLFKPSPAK